MNSHFPVIVVGAGQAGLSVSYCLTQQGVEHLVLERHRVGHSWRCERWDTFCLVTPNWQCRLPGYPYSGADPRGFMKRDEIVAYVEGYARSFSANVLEGVEVSSLTREANQGAFELETSAGRFRADQVVIATGSYHQPSVPPTARLVPPHITTLHSSAYKNPAQLPEGAVLVVGTGQSGCQIAEDLHFAGRRVHLAVGNAPRCARRYRGRDVVEWLDQMGYYDIPIDEHPNREQVRDKTNHYVTGRDGGRDIDLRSLALEGMRLYGPLAAFSESGATFNPELSQHLDAADAVYASINRTIDKFIAERGLDAPSDADYVPPWRPETEPLALDFEREGIRSIVYSTGFRADFGWIHLPAFDASGYPQHERGVTRVPGLTFIGLPWLYSWGSGRFSGVGRDADYLALHIAARASLATERISAATVQHERASV